MRRMMGKISAEDINDIRFVRIVIRHDYGGMDGYANEN